MSFELVITRKAHEEALDAYTYYESRSIGLGERFLEALSKRYVDLSLHPSHYSFIDEDPEQILRDVRLEKFPFVIVFEKLIRK